MRQLYSREGYQRERGLVPLRKRRSNALWPFHEDQLARMKVNLGLQAEQRRAPLDIPRMQNLVPGSESGIAIHAASRGTSLLNMTPRRHLRRQTRCAQRGPSSRYSVKRAERSGRL